jgi:glutamine phosphoribosylpyrophosphate amidotransferase
MINPIPAATLTASRVALESRVFLHEGLGHNESNAESFMQPDEPQRMEMVGLDLHPAPDYL